MALDPHICANITSDHFKGAQPRTHTWICRPLLSLHVLRASCWEQVWRASSETPSPPPLALTTCCLKDNITPCKQAADRLQVLGQEQTRGGLSVFVRVRTRPEWRHHTCVLHACRGTEVQILSNSQNLQTLDFVIIDVSQIYFSTNLPLLKYNKRFYRDTAATYICGHADLIRGGQNS